MGQAGTSGISPPCMAVKYMWCVLFFFFFFGVYFAFILESYHVLSVTSTRSLKAVLKGCPDNLKAVRTFLIMSGQIVSVLHQNEGGIGKSIPDAREIS